MIETALRTLLLRDPLIVQRVGARVYADERPQGAPLPAVEVWRVGTARLHTHRGLDGYTAAAVQVDVWAVSGGVSGRAQAREIADRAVAVLAGYRGIVGAVDIQGIFATRDRAANGEQSGGAPRVRGVQLEFDCHYKEFKP